MWRREIFLLFLGALAWTACEVVDTEPEEGVGVHVELDDLAKLLSASGFGIAQVGEVYDAVCSSSENGYDEEYMMCDLFNHPGYGVGDTRIKLDSKADGNGYEKPMREFLRESLESQASKAAISIGGDLDVPLDVDAYLDALESSDMQIYWPYSQNWDGRTMPVITYDPGDGSEVNVGYSINRSEDGSLSIEEVIVDEQMAMERPVWVVNSNDDSGLTTLEMRRLTDPGWGEGGGDIYVKPAAVGTHKMLVLKTLTMLRNFDSWFAGASELSFKAGSADGFTASTEAELKLYQPTITDFDMVLKRSYKGVELLANTVLISDWTDQIENCVLLITEYDGGTQTSWKCNIVAKYNSKSYGLEVDIPYHEKDDIIWRGQLSRDYMERRSGQTGHFGEMDLVFELVNY